MTSPPPNVWHHPPPLTELSLMQTISDIKTELKGIDEFVPELGATVRFKLMKDRKKGESWILLVYGPSKTGKTYFAGTCGERTLFINVGDGLATLQSPDFTNKYDVGNMIIIDVSESNDVATAFDKVCRAIDYALKNFPDKFDNIVLDEGTAFRSIAMNRAMELNTEASTKRTRASRLHDYLKSEIQDYGIEMDMIKWFLETYIPIFKRHKKNFLMLAHERQIFNKPAKIGDEGTLKKIMPGFTGKTFPDTVPSYFDDVWHSEVFKVGDNNIYQLVTKGSAAQVGGSRHGGIFQREERNPNFLEMLKRIQNA